MSSSVLIDKSSVSLYFSTVSIIKPCKNLLGEDVLRDLSLVLCAMREGAFAEASFAFQCMAGWLVMSHRMESHTQIVHRQAGMQTRTDGRVN